MRIRTIKPEFYLHFELYQAEEETKLPLRIAYSGLWCAADREGRFKWKPLQLGAQILPYDAINFQFVLEALASRGFIVKYQHAGDSFGYIPSFKQHQCINVREAQSSLPDPAHCNAHADTCTHVQDIHVKRVAITDSLRAKIYNRDGNACVRCSATEDLTIDHILPVSIGGINSEDNLRTLCRACNSRRPVAGQPLVNDLAKDGFTIEALQRMCMHVHARGEGKGREGNMEGKGKEGKGGLGGVADEPQLISERRKAFDPSSLVIPTELNTQEFRTAWDKWVSHRRQVKACKDWEALFTEQLDWLVQYGVTGAIEILSLSTLNRYQGLFPPKAGSGQRTGNQSGSKRIPESGMMQENLVAKVWDFTKKT